MTRRARHLARMRKQKRRRASWLDGLLLAMDLASGPDMNVEFTLVYRDGKWLVAS